MKKITAILLVLLMAMAIVACSSGKTPATETPTGASSTTETPTAEPSTPAESTPSEPTIEPAEDVVVCVSIVDQTGKLALAQKAVSVKDLNADGKLTIDETFVCAHEAEFPGGKDGYVAGESAYGLSIYKLWGSDDGKSFSYYLNGQMAGGLTDEVAKGDFLDAFVYMDAVAYSDTYCYFDTRSVAVSKGEAFTLKLTKQAGFDENWAPIFDKADAGVQIVIDGEVSEYTIDENGSVTFSLSESGEHVISATAASLEGVNLVPPVCIVTVG